MDTDQTRTSSGLAAIPPRDVPRRAQVVQEDPCAIRVDPWPVSRHGAPLPSPAKPPVVVRPQEELPAAGQVLVAATFATLTPFPSPSSGGRGAIVRPAEETPAGGQVASGSGRPAAVPPSPSASRPQVISTWDVLYPGGVIQGESGGPYVPPVNRALVVAQVPAEGGLEPGQVLAGHNPFQAMRPSPRSLTVAAQEPALDPAPSALVSRVQAPAPVRTRSLTVAAQELYGENPQPIIVRIRPTAAGGVLGPIYLSAAGVFVLGPTEAVAYVLGPTAAQVFILGPTEEESR